MFDVALINTDNGGDIQLLGNDLALIFGIENNPFLAMFGGNVEQVTKSKVTEEQSFDYWANALLFSQNPAAQFNSITEKTIRNTELTSGGRVIIENAVKTDLEYLKKTGAKIEVSVSITATDRFKLNIKITQKKGGGSITIINFKKKAEGDFSILDFNNDFFV